MDFILTEEQTKLKAKAREFAIREVLPVARKYDESEEFPLPVIKKAWEEKLLNLGIPKKYGGQGWIARCLFSSRRNVFSMSRNGNFYF